MSRIFTTILVSLIGFMSAFALTSYAAVVIPGGDKIKNESIGVTIAPGGSINSAKDFGLRVLGAMRIAISGIALIYLVMIGVYMILGSDNEETVKKQRKQITYALIGFLFLNIPSFVYTIFVPNDLNTVTIGAVDDWSSTRGNSTFWNPAGFTRIVGNIIAFLKVFAFGVAVTMFTWGLFSLIVSGGDDEKWKKAKNRVIYGIVGLIFLWFVQIWWQLVAVGDFESYIPRVGRDFFSLVMYIAAPIAIFMLTWWAYLFITSAGDEERIKKWKSIFINTGIALIILLAGLSFMTDLIGFQL